MFFENIMDKFEETFFMIKKLFAFFILIFVSGYSVIYADETVSEVSNLTSETTKKDTKEVVIEFGSLSYINPTNAAKPPPHWPISLGDQLRMGDTLLLVCNDRQICEWFFTGIEGGMKLIETKQGIVNYPELPWLKYEKPISFRFEVVKQGPFRISFERVEDKSYDFCGNENLYTFFGDVRQD